jgi:uncharacterized protein YndB with AHSA1/START domain
MSSSIKHRFFFPHQPEVVWEYLTRADLMAQWLMENDFQAIVGLDFQFRTRPMPNFDFDGIVYCKVLEVVPFTRLTYSWKGGPGNGLINLDSIVYWTLHAKGNGTELELEHSGFKEANFTMYSIMNDGWFKNVNKIFDLIKTNGHDPAHA